VDRGRKAGKGKYLYGKKELAPRRRNCGKPRVIHIRGASLPASFKYKIANQAF
jgi:hypothetical protein